MPQHCRAHQYGGRRSSLRVRLRSSFGASTGAALTTTGGVLGAGAEVSQLHCAVSARGGDSEGEWVPFVPFDTVAALAAGAGAGAVSVGAGALRAVAVPLT